MPFVSLFRLWSHFLHRLTAWNTGGEGIHSPYLFYLVRHLMYDRNTYYCWTDIESVRRQMLSDTRVVEVTDFGTGQGRSAHRRICDIARTSLAPSRNAQLLFRWLAYLAREKQGAELNVVELGTSLGITTAYLAAANKRLNVLTFDGSEAVVAEAKANWQRLGVSEQIEVVVGNLDSTLETTLHNRAHATRDRESGYGIDLAFLDANHTYDATMRYWKQLLPYHGNKSIFAVDDIRYSPDMAKAWREIMQDECVTSTMDFGDMGIVFFDPQYMRRHYKLRY
ncbi:MAG: class I SAM-dependent methyltransferase [Paludibacteraceae bacterium]|nr:class I SAM-dependent methyltransferase [Paludibacteraceae bacterium]